ncbi:hypothetical protein GCM10009733_051450 [Nonomuraea maheshkhaliensis]|uniref:Uncharacterized protein n=1 Tax=Nonomuraea maheshkhaliensis TaxID=419590 RepID=A0ABP4RHM2_9ACTN
MVVLGGDGTAVGGSEVVGVPTVGELEDLGASAVSGLVGVEVEAPGVVEVEGVAEVREGARARGAAPATIGAADVGAVVEKAVAVVKVVEVDRSAAVEEGPAAAVEGLAVA